MFQDILSFMDMKCSGQRACVILTSSLIGEGFHPCPVNVMSYIEASYECIPGDNIQMYKKS